MSPRNQALALIFVFVPLAGRAYGQQFAVTNSTVTPSVSVHFEEDSRDSPQISQVTSGSSTFSFETGAGVDSDLWQLELLDDVQDPLVTITPSDPAVSYVFVRIVINPSFNFFWWQGVTHPSLTAETFDVAVAVEAVPGEPLLKMDLAVFNSVSGDPLDQNSIDAIHFPRARFLKRASGSNEVLSIPFVGGWLVEDPSENVPFRDFELGNKFQAPGSLGMQWFSYYDKTQVNSGSLFFGTRDTEGHKKEYRFKQKTNPSGFVYFVRQQLANPFDAHSFLPPFKHVIGIKGTDWYDGARLYRNWAKGTSIVPSPMHSNTDFSPTIKDARMLATYIPDKCDRSIFEAARITYIYDRFEFLDRDIVDHEAEFNVGSIPSLVYAWDRNTWDDNVQGHWWPARQKFVDEVQNKLNPNNRKWASYFVNIGHSDDGKNPNSPIYQSSFVPNEPAMVKKRDGSFLLIDPPRLAYSRDNCNPGMGYAHDRYFFCFHDHRSGWFQNFHAHNLGLLGAEGIYLDLFTHQNHVECYDLNHTDLQSVGHPQGGGSWHTAAKRAVVDDLRSKMRDPIHGNKPNFYTMSESQNELYLNQFEVVLESITNIEGITLTSMTTAPLFETVYHDYQITTNTLPFQLPHDHTGNNIDNHDATRLFYSVRIYYGGIPFGGSILSPTTLSDNRNNPAFQGSFGRLLDCIKNLVKLVDDQSVRTYTTFGERLRDPIVANPLTTSVHAGYMGIFKLPGTQPFVLASHWARVDNDKSGVLLQNWTHLSDRNRPMSLPAIPLAGDQTVSITVDTSNLQGASYQIWKRESNTSWVQHNNPASFVPSNATQINDISVKEISATFLEFR